MQSDLYAILEVERTATEAELKTAYRRAAMANHPDRNPGNDAAEARFKQASEAYCVLSNPQKRAAYDRFGHAGTGYGRSTGGHYARKDPGKKHEVTPEEKFNNLVAELNLSATAEQKMSSLTSINDHIRANPALFINLRRSSVIYNRFEHLLCAHGMTKPVQSLLDFYFEVTRPHKDSLRVACDLMTADTDSLAYAKQEAFAALLARKPDLLEVYIDGNTLAHRLFRYAAKNGPSAALDIALSLRPDLIDESEIDYLFRSLSGRLGPQTEPHLRTMAALAAHGRLTPELARRGGRYIADLAINAERDFAGIGALYEKILTLAPQSIDEQKLGNLFDMLKEPGYRYSSGQRAWISRLAQITLTARPELAMARIGNRSVAGKVIAAIGVHGDEAPVREVFKTAATAMTPDKAKAFAVRGRRAHFLRPMMRSLKRIYGQG